MQNNRYEHFFSEEIEHPFFIKNIENVQGDERDTIIFSIGYAKDMNGVMYRNFGPLSRPGGHRRLNVAITRAKYNVKLVGSIHPTEIRLENTSPEGVRMLRQYIEFAINGPSVLQNELTFSNTVDVDSPFEEAIYDYLIKNGYSVTTQVGCSGYRIDMAVKHPTLNGIYVLGIECDGATYHSARTARERDRLRQTVLEDISPAPILSASQKVRVFSSPAPILSASQKVRVFSFLVVVISLDEALEATSLWKRKETGGRLELP